MHRKGRTIILVPRRKLAAGLSLGCLLILLVIFSIQAAEHQCREYWEKTGLVFWEVPTAQPLIALTFDDGPSPTFTPQIYFILKKYHVRATFFPIGTRVAEYHEIIRELALAGNEIGNHTFSHADTLEGNTAEEVAEEIMLADRSIYEITGKHPKLFRPPGGYYSETIIDTAARLGYQVVIWSWDQNPRDWANPGTKKIVDHVLKNAKAGTIVLLHDQGRDRTQTVEALRPIIEGLISKGFKLVTVSELLAQRTQSPAPEQTLQKKEGLKR